MNTKHKIVSAAALATVAFGTFVFAPAANAATNPNVDAPAPAHTTIFPPSDPSGKVTYFVLDAQGNIAETSVGYPGPMARALGAVAVSSRLTVASPAITEPSACGSGHNHDLDLLRQGGKSFCFNGQGTANVAPVTNVTEIFVGPHYVADIHWHTPGEGVGSNIAIINRNQEVVTNSAHWTADSISLS